MTDNPIVVLAGDYNQFRYWQSQEMRINRQEAERWVYCDNRYRLFTMPRGFSLKIVGTFWERSDADDLYREAHERSDRKKNYLS